MTYQQVNNTLHNVPQHQDNNIDLLFGLKDSDDQFNCFPWIYCHPKMHKLQSGPRFIVASKKSINKQCIKK